VSGTSERRRRQLAAIHIAAKQLGLDRETYEAMLWSIARAHSAAELDEAGRMRVLDHLRSRGAASRRGVSGTRPGRATDGQLALIRRLWMCLAEAGEVRRGDEAGLRAFAQRATRRRHPARTGYAALEFLPRDAARELIEHLKQWARRTRVDWKSSA